MELVLAKLLNWLENQMHNLNCQLYEELCEAIIRYIGNQKSRSEKFVKQLEKEKYRTSKDTPYRGQLTELKKADFTRNHDKPQPYFRDLKTVECMSVAGKKDTCKKTAMSRWNKLNVEYRSHQISTCPTGQGMSKSMVRV